MLTSTLKEFAIENRYTADLAANRIELESPEDYANGEYYPDGILLLAHDSLDIWSFPDEATATQWLQDQLLCIEGHKLMGELPIEVAVRSVIQMPDKVWDSNREWWCKFYLIVAANFSAEIGVELWVKVNDLLGRLKG